MNEDIINIKDIQKKIKVYHKELEELTNTSKWNTLQRENCFELQKKINELDTFLCTARKIKVGLL